MKILIISQKALFYMIKDKDSVENLREQIVLLCLIKSKTLPISTNIDQKWVPTKALGADQWQKQPRGAPRGK